MNAPTGSTERLGGWLAAVLVIVVIVLAGVVGYMSFAVPSLQSSNQTLENEIQTLQNQESQMSSQLGALSSRLAALNSSAAENATVAKLQGEVDQLQGEVGELELEIFQLRLELSQFTSTNTTVTTSTTFTVTASTLPLTACPSRFENTSLGPIPTVESLERKMVSASGLIWEFYTDGTDIVYRSSADGATWSSPTVVIPGAIRSYWFTVYQNGSSSDQIWFAYATSYYSDPVFEYGNGTLNADGTISWRQPFMIGSTTGTVPNTPSLTSDGSGHMWLAMETYQDDGTRHIEVYRLNSGWEKVFDVGGLVEWPQPMLTPLSDGGMALSILSAEGRLSVYATGDGGVSWTGPTNTTSAYQDISAVAAGGAVYYAGVTLGGTLQAWNYTLSRGIGAPAQLLPAGSQACGATISTDGKSSLAVAFSDSSTVLMTTSTDLGGVWSAPRLVSVGNVDIEPTSLTSDYFITGNVLVMWSDASLSLGIYQVGTAIVPFQ